jgi:diadenylate cyclase
MARRPPSMHAALASVAPGTLLREGIDRIVKAKMGALVVVGDGPDVLAICSGGFLVDAGFTPQRLSELAKMDGAIILAPDISRIARANVHLVPDPTTPTSETGTRHRTAERVARSLGVPVISVSEDMSVISVYVGDLKHVLEEIPRLLGRANQALATLERYRRHLDTVSASLSSLEVQDVVTLRDVGSVLQRTEMVRRIADEIEISITELGADSRLIRLQLDELLRDLADDRWLVIQDYVSDEDKVSHALEALASFDMDELLDLRRVVSVLALSDASDLDAPVQPRGNRILARIPRLPEPVIDAIVARFGSLPKIMRASNAELLEIDGIGDARATAIRDGLSRLAESSVLDRYQ